MKHSVVNTCSFSLETLFLESSNHYVAHHIWPTP